MQAASAERRWSISSTGKEKFPDLDHSPSGDYLTAIDASDEGATTSSRTPSPAKSNGITHSERCQARKDHHLVWGNGYNNITPPRAHGRQRSLSDAFKTIRSRKASVSENAREVAEALKAPVSMKIVVRTSLIIIILSTKHASGSMPCLVLELRLDQYFFQIHS